MSNQENGFPKRGVKSVFVFAFAAIIGLGACAEDDPTGPGGGGGGGGGPDPTPSCETNHSANVTFKNSSRRSTYDVLLDGSRIGVIAAGERISRKVSAGVSHTVLFRYSNTNQNACSQSSNSFVQCSSRILSCSSDQ